MGGGKAARRVVAKEQDLQTAIAGLKSLEKNREELLSNVSHDLKNPLTTVKAYLTMLNQGKLGELSERQLKAVQTCERMESRLVDPYSIDKDGIVKKRG